MSRIITLPNFLILLKPSPLGCLGDIQGFYDSTPRPCRCPICELTHLDRAGQRQGFFPPVYCEGYVIAWEFWQADQILINQRFNETPDEAYMISMFVVPDDDLPHHAPLLRSTSNSSSNTLVDDETESEKTQPAIN